MKKVISLLLIISSTLFMGGCNSIFSNYREIQQLLVVQTMGLDLDESGVLVSMAAATEASSSTPRQLCAQGGTISAAIDRAYDLSYEEEIFFSHVNHMLIGEASAEQGIEGFLDYVCQSATLRMDIPLYIVRSGTANQAVMTVGDGNKGISEIMQSVRESFASPSNSQVFTVADVLSSLDRYGSALVCAVDCVPSSESKSDETKNSPSGEQQGGAAEEGSAEEAAAEEGAQKESTKEESARGESTQQDPLENSNSDNPLMAAPAGYAIIRDGKLCKFIEPEQSLALGLLTDSVPICSIVVDDTNGKPSTLEISTGKAEILPLWEGSRLRGLDIHAQVSASVLETGTRNDSGGEEYINFLTGQLEAYVSQHIKQLLQDSMQLKADFLGLASRVERASPEKYRLLSQSFPELLPGLELQLSVSGQLSHTNDMKEV